MAAGENASVTRHEERLNVAKERREAGKARLRKYVVTEQQQVDVPVTREEVHVTREPVNERVDGNVQLGEETQTVTLHEERPVISTEVYAVERLRLSVDRETQNMTYTDTVRREVVDFDLDGDTYPDVTR